MPFIANQLAIPHQLETILSGDKFLVGMTYLAALGYALLVLTLLEGGVVWLLRRFAGRTAAKAEQSEVTYWRSMNRRYERLVAGGRDVALGRLGRWAFLLVLTAVLTYGVFGVYMACILPGLYLLLFGWTMYVGAGHAGMARTVAAFLGFLSMLCLAPLGFNGWMAVAVLTLLFVIFTREERGA